MIDGTLKPQVRISLMMAAQNPKNYLITNSASVVTFRSDNMIWDFADLSVREIQPHATQAQSTLSLYLFIPARFGNSDRLGQYLFGSELLPVQRHYVNLNLHCIDFDSLIPVLSGQFVYAKSNYLLSILLS